MTSPNNADSQADREGLIIGTLALRASDATLFSNTQVSKRERKIVQAIADEMISKKAHSTEGYREALIAYMRQNREKAGQFVNAFLRGDERACGALLQTFDEAASQASGGKPGIVRTSVRSALADFDTRNSGPVHPAYGWRSDR